MNNGRTFTPVQLLALHALQTIPDSTKARKELLQAVAGALRDNDSIKATAKTMLEAMRTVDRVQAELFADLFPPSSK